mgnify:CR=1 FL=1
MESAPEFSGAILNSIRLLLSGRLPARCRWQRITSVRRQKKIRLSPTKVVFGILTFFLSYLAEPIDEPGSSTLGDYANPFDDSQPDSQESTLSADFTTIDVKITRQKKEIEEDNLDSEEEIAEENGIEGDYEGGEEVEQEETSDQEIQAILNFSQRQG